MQFVAKLIITLIGVHLVSWGYNALIAWLEREGYMEGFTSLSVVVGVAYTVLATTWLIGGRALLVLTLTFVASGLPMVAGSIARHLQDRKREKRYLLDHARKVNRGDES